MRLQTRDKVQVEFGRQGGEVFVVTLTCENQRWRFEDVNSPDAGDFDQLPLYLADDAPEAVSPEPTAAH